jgi:PBP1b-binding outer membrane lipoprotein LpoB
MKKTQIIALFLILAILGISSCAQKPCPAYTKADLEYKKDKKEGRF